MPHKKEYITNLQREYWEVSDVFIYLFIISWISYLRVLYPQPTTPTIHLNILYGWGERYSVPSSDVFELHWRKEEKNTGMAVTMVIHLIYSFKV